MLREAIDAPPHATTPKDNEKNPLNAFSKKEKQDWMDIISKNHTDLSKAVSIFAKKYPHLKDNAGKLAMMKKFVGSSDSDKHGAE